MSRNGIKLAAKVFEFMQLTRGELLRLGTAGDSTKGKTAAATSSGKQDILLAQMLQDANDAIKYRFAELTMMNTDERKAAPR